MSIKKEKELIKKSNKEAKDNLKSSNDYLKKNKKLIKDHKLMNDRIKKSKEWKKSYKKHGVVLTWENIQNSIIPQIPKQKRPYLKEIMLFSTKPESKKLLWENDHRILGIR